MLSERAHEHAVLGRHDSGWNALLTSAEAVVVLGIVTFVADPNMHFLHTSVRTTHWSASDAADMLRA